MDKREFYDGVQVKVMADGGQGFLKICLTVLPKNYNPSHEKGVAEENVETEEEAELDFIPTKRSLYSDGRSSGKK